MKLSLVLVALSWSLSLPLLGAEPKATVPTVQYKKINYKGWVGCYELVAPPYRVVVAPKIGGRIVEYSRNGRGPIWLNEAELGKVHPLDPKVWWNYGGYKTWPAPQSKWNWPPDPQLDAAPATVGPWSEKGKLVGLKITGQTSEKLGLHFEKYVRLDPATGSLHLRQRMIALPENDDSIRWGVWSITQVLSDGWVAIPLNPKSRHEGGVYFYGPEAKQSKQWHTRDGLLILKNAGDAAKYGADTNDGWMAWLRGGQAYVQRFPAMIPGEEYPDEASSAQAWCNSADLPYTEMELAGPLVTLKPGASTEFEEEWQLIDLSHPVKTEDDVIRAVRELKQSGYLKPLGRG
jgi:hypothetical protein